MVRVGARRFAHRGLGAAEDDEIRHALWLRAGEHHMAIAWFSNELFTYLLASFRCLAPLFLDGLSPCFTLKYSKFT